MEKKKIVKNVLKVALIVIVILLIILIIHTIRNYVIITDLQNKIAKYNNSTNYHIKSVATEKDGTIVKMDYYEKENRQVVLLERHIDGKTSKVSIYNNGERTDTFTETKDEKIVQLNSGTLINVNIFNNLENDKNWQTFLGSMFAKVRTDQYNGRECYVINDFMSEESLSFENQKLYIDKETGLALKIVAAGIVNEKEYEFNNVDNSIFAEPDISQYTLKENE